MMVATNHGKLYSPEFYESSYRSELFSVLAGMVTLCAIIGRGIKIKQQSLINIYCDNKLIIKRIRERCTIRRTVNQHRDAEVDLELQVLHEIKMLETTTSKYKWNM
jgi:hypothetical protein